MLGAGRRVGLKAVLWLPGAILLLLFAEVALRPITGSPYWRLVTRMSLGTKPCRPAILAVAKWWTRTQYLTDEQRIAVLIDRRPIQKSRTGDLCIITLRRYEGPAWFRAELDGCPVRFHVREADGQITKTESLEGLRCYLY